MNYKIIKIKEDIKKLMGKEADFIEPTSHYQHAYFAAYLDETMVAHSIVLKTDKWILDGLLVHPDYRCQGIAKQLTKARLDYAKGQGAKEIWYCCSDENIASIKSHVNYEFKKIRPTSKDEAPCPSHWYRLNL